MNEKNLAHIVLELGSYCATRVKHLACCTFIACEKTKLILQLDCENIITIGCHNKAAGFSYECTVFICVLIF